MGLIRLILFGSYVKRVMNSKNPAEQMAKIYTARTISRFIRRL